MPPLKASLLRSCMSSGEFQVTVCSVTVCPFSRHQGNQRPKRLQNKAQMHLSRTCPSSEKTNLHLELLGSYFLRVRGLESKILWFPKSGPSLVRRQGPLPSSSLRLNPPCYLLFASFEPLLPLFLTTVSEVDQPPPTPKIVQKYDLRFAVKPGALQCNRVGGVWASEPIRLERQQKTLAKTQK